MQYDNNNTGALFRNDKGDNPKRPDYKGNATVDGAEYKISAWLQKSKKDGSTFMSLKLERKTDERPVQQQRPQQQQSLPSDEPDAIPF